MKYLTRLKKASQVSPGYFSLANYPVKATVYFVTALTALTFTKIFRRATTHIMVHAVSLENSNGNGAANGGHATMEGETAMPRLTTQPPPDMNWAITLKDRVIAITGANRGIGLGIAEVCLANNAKCVYSLDLMNPSEDFQALAKKHPDRFKYQQMDVTKEDSVKKAIDNIVEAEGAIHGMVCNAGMTKHQPALEFSMEQVEQLFRLNVFGVFACATAAARKFISLGIKGSIVFTASMTSYRPNRAAPSAPYGGTKAAVRNMAHTLGYGVGGTRHPGKQHQPRLREDRHDLLH